MEQMICKIGTVFGRSENIGTYALAFAANALAAEGARIFHAVIQILVPAGEQNSHLYAVEKKMKKICQERRIEFADIQIIRDAPVNQCTVTVFMYACISQKEQENSAEAGQDIVLIHSVGTEGVLRILDEKEEELGMRFSSSFLSQIRGVSSEIFAVKEIEAAAGEGVSMIRQAGEGGIFAALWNLAKETDKGLEADLKKISIRQETIEVCEYFRLNPYQLASCGTLLVVANEGEALSNALMEKGIEAAVIGRLTEGNDKIIRNGGEVRYLNRPVSDEVNKLFQPIG